MAVSVTFAGRDTGLDAMNKKVAQSAGRIDEGYKAAARESKAFENAGLRAVRTVETGTERLARVQAGLNRLVQQGRISQEQANRAMRGAHAALMPQQQSLVNMNSELRTYAKGWLGIQGAVSIVTRAFAKQREILEGVATAQTTLAQAQADLIAQLQGVDPQRRRQFLQEIVELGPQVGIKPSILTQQVSELFTATTGGFEDRRKTVLETLNQVAPLFLTKPQEIGDFGGAFQAFLQTAKAEGVGLSDADAFSLFLQARSQARISSIEKLKNIVPAIKAIEVAGEGAATLKDLKAGIAAFALIGSRAEDPEGEKTRTAIVKLVQVLEDRFPDLGFLEQLQATAGLSEAQQKELFKPLSALRGIGPVVRDILSGRRQAEFQEILDSLKISADQSAELRRALLTDTEALRENTRTAGATAAAEAALMDRTSAGAVQRRLFGGPQGPGALDAIGLPGEREVLEFVAQAVLSAGLSPELVERTVLKSAERGLTPLTMLINLMRNSNDTQAEMADSLKNMERNFGIDLDRAPTPEN